MALIFQEMAGKFGKMKCKTLQVSKTQYSGQNTIQQWPGHGGDESPPPLSSRTTFEIRLNPLRNWGGGG
jgi:hypothetical protein